MSSSRHAAVRIHAQLTLGSRLLVADRAILLDRTLRALGIEEDDPAPPGVLQQFEAKTRRRLDLYYKSAHVCANCARWYERQSRRRAAELDALNSPLEPLLYPSKAAVARLSTMGEVAMAAAGSGDAGTPGEASEASRKVAERPRRPSKTRARNASVSSSFHCSDTNMPESFQRAMMRTSASFPALTLAPTVSQPQPSRRVGDSRTNRIVSVT